MYIMSSITDKLKKVKSLKTSFDILGYAVSSDGSITQDRDLYRNLLRSGKVPTQKQYSSDRTVQVNHFYKYYFNGSQSLLTTPRYKAVIQYLILEKHEKLKYNKHAKQVGDKLIKLRYFELFVMSDGNRLLRDHVNNKDFYYSEYDHSIYRLVNSKPVKYNLGIL